MSTVTVFVDDAALPADSFLGTQWVHETNQVEAYGGTTSVCQAGSTTTGFSLPPSLTAFFAGTEAVLYGTLTKGVAGTYSVDFGPSQPMIFSDSPIGKPGVELWRLTGLTSAYHTLEIQPTAGDLTIDYVTYSPIDLTLLSGNNLVFDDQHPALQYSKGWVGTTDEQYPQAAPYLGTTTGTNTVGSSMKLNFNGDIVAVYGVLQSVPGVLTVSFSVDGATPTIYKPWNGTQANSSDWFVAWQMFEQTVPAGSHTLTVSLQEATGSQMLWLDSIITQAGLSTTLSNAVGGSGTVSSGGTTSPSLGGISPAPTFGTTTPSFNTHTSKSRLSGGAIGGLASGLSVLVAILLYILRRFLASRKKPTTPTIDPAPLMAQVPVTPTTPVYTPPPTTSEMPTPSPPPTTTTLPGPSLQETWSSVLNQQQGAQTPPMQTHWDTDDVSSDPPQPSTQGSTSNLRSWGHYSGHPEV